MHGPFSTLLIFTRCKWVCNGIDIRRNPTRWGWIPVYKLLSHHGKSWRTIHFPSQAQQMFFVVEDHNPQWKVILHKKSRFICCEVDLFIDSHNINDYVALLKWKNGNGGACDGCCYQKCFRPECLPGIIWYSVPCCVLLPTMLSVLVPAPWMLAPQEIRKSARSTTSGSWHNLHVLAFSS